MSRPAWQRRLLTLCVAALVYFGFAPYLHESENSFAYGATIGDDRYRYLLEFPIVITDKPPLVVALHGYGGDVGEFREDSALWMLIEQGYAVVFIQALLDRRGVTHWNANLNLSERDDATGLVGMVRHVQQRFGYDPARTFLVGYSNGGFMAYTLACNQPEVFAAMVMVNATMSGADWRTCAQPGSVPVMHVTGLNDTVVPPDGSMDDADGWGGAPSAHEVVAAWALAGGGVAQPVKVVSERVMETAYAAPQNRPVAKLVTVQGLDHDWPTLRNSETDILPMIDGFFQQAIAAQQ